MKIKHIFTKITATALAITCIAGVTTAMAAESTEKTSSYPVLKEFTANTLDNEEMTQDILKDADITMVYFWATYCGYCVDEMPEIAAFIKSMPDNVQMISVCGDGMHNQELVNRILEETGFKVPTILDGDKDLIKLFSQTIYTPTLYFIDQEGNVIGDPLIGAPKELEPVYTELLDHVFEELEIEPVYEEEAADAEESAGEDDPAAEESSKD